MGKGKGRGSTPVRARVCNDGWAEAQTKAHERRKKSGGSPEPRHPAKPKPHGHR